MNQEPLRVLVFILGLNLVHPTACHADPSTKQEFDQSIDILCQGTEKAGHYRVLATVDKIFEHGDQALPWLMGLLDDKRTMGTIVIRTRGEGHFEDFVTYSPTYIGDAARAILNGLTGFGERTGLERISDAQRAKAIKKWRVWYKRYKDKLKWLPDKHEFEWKEKKEPRIGKLSCSFPRSAWE